MSKIIIHNKSKATDEEAVNMVSRVIGMGFVSGENQYCWASHFQNVLRHTEFTVIANRARGDTHTFKVINKDGE